MNNPSSSRLPVIGISMGDPAGIGPELCLRVLRDPEMAACCRPVVFGDAGVLCRVAQCCGLPAPEQVAPVAEWKQAGPGPLVADCGEVEASDVIAGRVSAACGRAAYGYILAAIRAATSGDVQAVVTAPLHKESLAAAGVPFPGHTEILAAETGAETICMMLTAPELSVSLVTVHLPYAAVPAALNSTRIGAVIDLTVEAMRRQGLAQPRITVCGLNPHAGEHGLFGNEEQAIIAPAIAAARARGLSITGPLPPDTAFLPVQRRQTDAYVAMYHDQGLIPFKMLAFEIGVNVTLGLPIIRASVDHGTAFDIAWQGVASAASLRSAVLWAVRQV